MPRSFDAPVSGQPEKEVHLKSATPHAATGLETAAGVEEAASSSLARLRERYGLLRSRLSIPTRLRLVLVMMLVPPPALLLYLAETRPAAELTQAVALWLVLALLAVMLLAGWLGRWVVLGDLAALNDFCAALRRGEYARRLPLPAQADDENELLLLKRDLNWLAHHIETRETWLQARLDETHQRRCLFENLSRTDALTGLFNRRHFDRALAEQTRSALSGQTRLTLLLIDCDAFKSVNDRYGHPAGDAVLAGMGRVLRESVREGLDLAFRLGGDEFALLLANLGGPEALAVARRIRLAFAAANPYGTTASIGLASLAPVLGATDADRSLVERCDAALYRVKATGGDGESLADGCFGHFIDNENHNK